MSLDSHIKKVVDEKLNNLFSDKKSKIKLSVNFTEITF